MLLLINANHLMMVKITFTEFGAGMAKPLAGNPSVSNRFALFPGYCEVFRSSRPSSSLASTPRLEG